MNCTYYQCSNNECKFRFPVYEKQEYKLYCPVCKSKILRTTSVEIKSENLTHHQEFSEIYIEAFFDNIRSAMNVGSMFRTADGFGVRHLYLCGITPTPEIKNVAKSSLGAERIIPWTYVKNGVDHIRVLKEQNRLIVAIEEHKKAKNIYSINPQQMSLPMVIVVGNEICGVDPDILDLCDFILNIPMMGIKKSLNVAVAFGIAISLLHIRLINTEISNPRNEYITDR